jgi:hypothetical protein
VWVEGQRSFEALQRRAVSGGRTAVRLAQEMPAHFVLQIDGQEQLHVPYGGRRAQLKQLFSDHGLNEHGALAGQTSDTC